MLHWLLVVAALAYVGFEAPALARSAMAGAGQLDDVHWARVAASVVLGLAAVAVYAEIHRQLLAVGGARLQVGVVQSVTLAENAIGTTVPVVGGVGSVAYAISRFHRRGVDSALAAWAVLLAGVLDTFCLIVLAAISLAAIGRLPVQVAVIAVVLVGAGAVAAWALVTHPPVLRTVLRPVLWLDRVLPTRCPDCRDRRAADLEGATNRFVARVGLLRPRPTQWLRVIGVTVISWLVDFLTLAVAASSVLGHVPWPALVVGFLVVQASIAVQVLPGGAGLAEVGLLGTLVAAGVAAGSGALVVLIYRVSSWLVPAVVGWTAYAVHIHVTQPRPHRHQVYRVRPAIGTAALDACDDGPGGRERGDRPRPAVSGGR
jgi:putative heme transporter